MTSLQHLLSGLHGFRHPGQVSESQKLGDFWSKLPSFKEAPTRQPQRTLRGCDDFASILAQFENGERKNLKMLKHFMEIWISSTRGGSFSEVKWVGNESKVSVWGHIWNSTWVIFSKQTHLKRQTSQKTSVTSHLESKTKFMYAPTSLNICSIRIEFIPDTQTFQQKTCDEPPKPPVAAVCVSSVSLPVTAPKKWHDEISSWRI